MKERSRGKVLYERCVPFAAFLLALVFFLLSGEKALAAHSLSDSSFTRYPDTNVYYSPSVSAEDLSREVSLLSCVPENIRERLLNDNAKIYLIAYEDEVLTAKRVSEYGNSSISVSALTTHPTYKRYVYEDTGEVAYAERISDAAIEIQTDTPANMQVQSERLVHEIGHFVDSAKGAATGTNFAISGSDEFSMFYKLYGEKVVQYSSYKAAPALYSASECWADCFRLAYTDAETLKAISPELLTYVLQETASIPSVEPSLKK